MSVKEETEKTESTRKRGKKNASLWQTAERNQCCHTATISVASHLGLGWVLIWVWLIMPQIEGVDVLP